jgi:hypothetical protein
MEQITTNRTSRIPAPRAYSAMTLGEIKTELVATFTAILNREADDDFLISFDTREDFDSLVIAAAAVINLEDALHHCRHGDVDFNPGRRRKRWR